MLMHRPVPRASQALSTSHRAILACVRPVARTQLVPVAVATPGQKRRARQQSSTNSTSASHPPAPHGAFNACMHGGSGSSCQVGLISQEEAYKLLLRRILEEPPPQAATGFGPPAIPAENSSALGPQSPVTVPKSDATLGCEPTPSHPVLASTSGTRPVASAVAASSAPRQQQEDCASIGVPAPTSTAPATDSHKSETCIVAHPGSLSCSTLTVHHNAATHSVVINQTTTVRLSDTSFAASISIADLERLGLLASERQLQDAAAARAAQTAQGSESVQLCHDAVLQVLSKGRVVEAEKRINGYGHVTFICMLEDPAGQTRVRAIFKPKVEGDCEGWHRVGVEVVAYRLNRLLGMDYVPPSLFLHQADVDWQHFEHGGTFMYWADNGSELETVPREQWGMPWEVVLSDARILDVLIQNSDRPHSHMMLAEHWARGKGRNPAQCHWKGALSTVFIDHAAGFRPGADVNMQHDNAFRTGETVHISGRTYLRLRCLDKGSVVAAMSEILTPTEIDEVMHRRDCVLAYFDRLVAERGYNSVVIEQ